MNGIPSSRRMWLQLASIVTLGAVNLFLPLFIVPKFERIFVDALPGQNLPALTNFILSNRIPLALVALVWMVVASVAVWRRHRSAKWIYYPGLLFFFGLVAVTVWALFKPMVGITTGLASQ